MRIYITPDGTWGDADELIFVSEADLATDTVGLRLYKELWEGCDGEALYSHLWEAVK